MKKNLTFMETIEKIKGIKSTDIEKMEDIKDLKDLLTTIEGLKTEDLKKSEIKQFTNKKTYINKRIDELENEITEHGAIEILNILGENKDTKKKDTKKVASSKKGISKEDKKATNKTTKNDKKADKKVVDIKENKDLIEYNKLSNALEPVMKMTSKDMEKLELEDLHNATCQLSQLITNVNTPTKRKKDLEKVLKNLTNTVKKLESIKPMSEVVVDTVQRSTVDLMSVPNIVPTEKIYVTLETNEVLQLCYMDDDVALLSDKDGAIQCSSSKLRKGFVVYSIGRNNYAFEIINSYIA